MDFYTSFSTLPILPGPGLCSSLRFWLVIELRMSENYDQWVTHFLYEEESGLFL